MFGTKTISVLFVAITLLFAQVGGVLAAGTSQETTPITGTIQNIQTETDANGLTTVLVTLADDQNVTQTVRISLEAAIDLGLIQVDPNTGEPVLDPVTGAPVVDDAQLGQPVEIDAIVVIPDDSPGVEEPVHLIAALLASFFGEDGSVVEGFHDDGFGFGVIAQAMWMSQQLNGDASVASQILDAKETGDYSAFVLPDGSTPANWGQFKKAVLEKKNNLGVIVSGQADPLTEDGADTQFQNGNGNGQGNGPGNGQGNGNGNGQGNGKDKGKGKDK
jgi:hypothetical protein